MVQVWSHGRIILVASAAWLRLDSVSLRFEFSFMDGSSFEPCLDLLVAFACDCFYQIRFNFVFEF